MLSHEFKNVPARACGSSCDQRHRLTSFTVGTISPFNHGVSGQGSFRGIRPLSADLSVYFAALFGLRPFSSGAINLPQYGYTACFFCVIRWPGPDCQSDDSPFLKWWYAATPYYRKKYALQVANLAHEALAKLPPLKVKK
jgi:hypothetical protein